MKKILVMLFAFSLLGATQVIAATNTETAKVSNTRIVKADKDTNLTYGKVKFFVPAGQALVLGQVDNGSVLVRAARLEGVKIGKATIDSKLPVALYVDPATNAIIVDQGKDVQLVDNNGRTAVMSQGAAVSGEDIRLSVPRSFLVTLPLSWQTKSQFVNPNPTHNNNKVNQTVVTPEAEGETYPDFLSDDEILSSTAYEQAVQDVEDSLSPSAPRN